MGGHQVLKPTKYRTIDDIPDELIKQYSRRDPDNLVYKTRRWVNYKKKQILYSQQDGVPIHLRTRLGRFSYYTVWISSFGLLAYNIYCLNKHLTKKN